MSSQQFHLNAVLIGVGHHEAAWPHPRTEPRRVLDVTHVQELGRITGRGAEPLYRAPRRSQRLITWRKVSS